MIECLSAVIGALSAGALAKAGDLGGQAVTDAYDTLRALVIRKLGKGGAVQLVEDEPHSQTAQAALAEALAKAGLGADAELSRRAEALRAAVSHNSGMGVADIDVGDITARADALVANLVASGRIKIGNIESTTGGVTLRDFTAGAGYSKKF